MEQKIYILIIILFGGITTFGQNSEQTNQIILKLKNDIPGSIESLHKQIVTGNSKIDSVSQKFGAVKIRKLSIGGGNNQNIYVIQFPQGTSIQQVIDEYYKTGEIKYAEPDYKGSADGAPNDQYYYRQWGLKNDGTFSLSPSVAGADIDMENAWNIEQGDSNIIVAIIDSGTKLDHPEFTGRVWKNYNEIPNNGIDDDNNGYIDDTKGWNFAYNNNDPTDDQGHGTNIIGIIGANGNNTIGYAGVDWNCKLMTLKGLDSNNSGWYSWWANAIYYAVNNGAKVINMSLSGANTSSTLQNAVNYALNNNVVVVVSMGNDNSSTVRYPAGFNGVITVGSTNANDTRTNPFFWDSSSGSNYGSHISVVAPGNYIYGLDEQFNTYYGSYWGGTSQSAPYVTGLAALLLAQDSSRTPAQIKTIIEASAEDQVGSANEDTPGWDQYFGHGRINAFNALTFYPCYIISDSPIAICTGDSTLIYGSYRKTSGTYYDSLLTVNGCDSIRSTILTVYPVSNTYSTAAICSGDSILLQGRYQTTAGTYYDTLTTVNGCDSVISTILDVNTSTSSFQSVTACGAYLWNGNYYTVSGSYSDTISNVASCDSMMTLNLSIKSVDTSVTALGNVLTANVTGATYQWLDCGNNYFPISGAINQTYTPTISGNYAVSVTQNGCTDTSSCYNIIVAGISERSADDKVFIYPNPANDLFTIECLNAWNRRFEIMDITGKTILMGELTEKKTRIDLSEYERGIYMLKIGGSTVKFVRQ